VNLHVRHPATLVFALFASLYLLTYKGVSAGDDLPSVWAVLLAAVAAAALGSYWPARAAMRLDPAAVMRED